LIAAIVAEAIHISRGFFSSIGALFSAVFFKILSWVEYLV